MTALSSLNSVTTASTSKVPCRNDALRVVLAQEVAGHIQGVSSHVIRKELGIG